MAFFNIFGTDRRKGGGPKVKTGPTAGLTRAKNKDGTWRGKRSDAGKSKK